MPAGESIGAAVRAIRRNRGAALLSAGLLLAVVVLVALSLRREPPLAFAPGGEPGPASDSLVGPARVTIDASSAEHWVFYDLSAGRSTQHPGGAPDAWDLAFRRFHVAVNGGPGFPGDGGVLDLGEIPFDSVTSLPTDGYVAEARRDSTNPAIARWYDYGFTSHLLTPKPHVYALRTADGRYAALRFLSYYCPGARPGCITFEYLYQGGGGGGLR